MTTTTTTTRTPDAAPAALHAPVIDWFGKHARDLPWRRPEAGAWGVMVSEFMLQQTPVARVLPVYEQWLARWPRPADLAAEPPGEAVRAWGRLGYPRRALRLHAAAAAIAERHGGDVPRDHAKLLALPGVGEYTAAAVASFAYGRRHAVLDTNVRRVFARAVTGAQYPPTATTAAERRLARALLPDDEATAAAWAAATMELGALVCTARTPGCHRCPIADQCAWRLAGSPAHDGPPRRGQTYAGTDRQVRGKLLAVLREAVEPVPQAVLDAVWDEPVQRARALDGLVADGLVEPLAGGTYRLPLG
jgi:A/G-specific adenine glycosylase